MEEVVKAKDLSVPCRSLSKVLDHNINNTGEEFMGGGTSTKTVHSSHPDSGLTSKEPGTLGGLCRA